MRLPPSLSSFWWWAVEINRCNPTKKPSFPFGKGRFLFGATEFMVNGACGVPLSYPISALCKYIWRKMMTIKMVADQG